MQLAFELKPQRWGGNDLGYGISDGTFAAQFLVAQEAERRRVSREMHDDLGQKMALLQFQIEGVKREVNDSGRALEELECLRGSVAALAEDLHRICYRLHPVVLDRLGLAAGIEYLCNEHARITGVTPKFHCEAVPETIPAAVALCVYRVVQEALNNVHKHACAKTVDVRLRGVAGGIQAQVNDTGCGFEVDYRRKSGLGLTSIRERVTLLEGRASIRSTPERGTRVEVFVPVEHSEVA